MTKLISILFWAILSVATMECIAQASSANQSISGKQEIITGADQTEKYLPLLKGKRIGLVANQSSIIGTKSSVDSLLSLGIRIVKVFGPEHGFRGNASNGAVVNNETDAKTGIPIISLYGKNQKPTKEQLADIDILVFDIQDVGCRYYTNINTLEYVMEACGEMIKNCSFLTGPIQTDMW